MAVGYFLDSYAVIEYLNDNPNYQYYIDKFSGMLTYYNIMQITYGFIDSGNTKVSLLVDALWHLIVEPTKEELVESVKFRKKHAKKRLSYADCLGYVIALKRKVKFLTGDKQFKGMKNVEFVK